MKRIYNWFINTETYRNLSEKTIETKTGAYTGLLYITPMFLFTLYYLYNSILERNVPFGNFTIALYLFMSAFFGFFMMTCMIFLKEMKK